jgi:ABC-type Fe3+/spermidine/putrescine transport system ATPase subunit
LLTVHDVHRSFGALRVLRGVDLALGEGEIICLLGPSGCGKTTLLRIIAGLESADSGDVRINGESIRDVPVHGRGFGLMFQDFALFPHLDVSGNVAFGLKMQGVARDEQNKRVTEALERVNLGGFERRTVATLSGGERQRVALARSLAPNPRLLMLDEPLGSLDAALRDELIVELGKIIKGERLSTIYVTHDQHEAFAIADRIAVMNAGRIEQIDAPTTLYAAPKTEFLARFLGMNNIVPVTQCADGIATTPLGTFPVGRCATTLLIHPDGISIARGDASDTVRVSIEETVFQGSVYRLRVRHGAGIELTFTLPAQHFASMPHPVGSTVALSVAADRVVPLEQANQNG